MILLLILLLLLLCFATDATATTNDYSRSSAARPLTIGSKEEAPNVKKEKNGAAELQPVCGRDFGSFKMIVMIKF